MRRKSFWKIPVLWTLPAVVLFFFFRLAGIVAGLEFLPAETERSQWAAAKSIWKPWNNFSPRFKKSKGWKVNKKNWPGTWRS